MRFSEELTKIAHEANGHRITIGEIESVLHGRGFAATLLIICIPFIQPIPLPGLSVPFGVAIALIGLRLAFRRKAHIPRMVRERTIETERLKKILLAGAKVFRSIEHLFKERLEVMFRWPLDHFIGLTIFLSGIALCLPLPPVVLFSNSIPAWAVIFCCLGFIERDGLLVMIGHVLGVATWIYFILVGETAWFAIEKMLDGSLRSILGF